MRRGSKRISVRLKDAQRASLETYCQRTEQEKSFVVRKALIAFLDAQEQGAATVPKPRRLTPPQPVFDRYQRFMNWSNGDLRIERKRLFIDLLAASFACKKLWLRTPGIIEGYEELLQLCTYFGVE